MAIHRGGETASPQRHTSYHGLMELGESPPLSGFARRAAPIACAGATIVAATFLATHDPGAGDSLFPRCAFHQVTGLWCPGCGLTRGLYQMMHGHIGAALGYNVFTPVAVVAIVAAWLGWLRVSWGASPIRIPHRGARWLAITAPALILVYGVLRNLPVAPLRALAP
jgi:hypothetical protein